MADQEQREESRSQGPVRRTDPGGTPPHPTPGTKAQDETQPAEEWGQRETTGRAIDNGGKPDGQDSASVEQGGVD